MELNWSTFILEIINFLILIWILKRFLYKPILNIVEQRRIAVEKVLHDAEVAKSEAQTLNQRYEERQANWEHERQLASEKLTQEIEEERARQMDALKSNLEKEQDAARAAESYRQAAVERAVEKTAMKQAARFASRLLEQFSGPELEAHFLDSIVNEISQLPEESTAKLRDSKTKMPEHILIESAYPINESQKNKLEKSLSILLGDNIPTDYEQHEDIICGLRISIGAWILNANIRDELSGFVELTNGLTMESL
jgi:F-type H+-transporting ATPase subunit b